jgi:hypothetical protein
MTYESRQVLIKSLREIREELLEYHTFLCTKGFTGQPVKTAAKRLNDLAKELENDQLCFR